MHAWNIATANAQEMFSLGRGKTGQREEKACMHGRMARSTLGGAGKGT